MRGMNAAVGDGLGGLDHLRQSIRDILTTRIGTRVMREDYGSDVPNLVDRPMTPAFTVDVIAATAVALDRWEPRFRLEKTTIERVEPGRVWLQVQGRYLPDGRVITMDGIEVT